MKTCLLATMLAATIAAPGAEAASFTFAETFGFGAYAGSPIPATATGSFDGDLSGGLITNLRNIRVFVNGVAFNGNGSLFAAGFDEAANLWVDGAATAALDGRANNIRFSDAASADPDAAPTNFYYSNTANALASVATGIGASGPTAFFGYSTALTPSSAPLTITQVEATGGAVPEPASWALMLVGFGVVGHAMRRRSVVSWTQAV